MKNLMTYINPLKEFTEDYSRLVMVQIDNGRHMGWRDEDILLVTNFPYSYKGLDSIVVPDELFCQHRRRASKINVICHLLKNGFLSDICWFHDFDAYQVDIFPENILGESDAAFTDYATSDKWNTGSFFFNQSSLDIFEAIRGVMNERRVNEEVALKYITDRDVDGINKRYLKLNNTYNLGRMRQNEYTYAKADKPIKVFHFHPRMTQLYEEVKPLLPTYLIEIFKKYGYS
jgi:hypothetical protein